MRCLMLLLLLASCAVMPSETALPPGLPEGASGWILYPEPRAPTSPASDIAAVEGDYTGWDAAGLGMRGEWRSEDDPRAGLSVIMDPERGPAAAHTYDGEADGYVGVRFVEACQGFEPGGDVILVIFGTGENASCYAIVSLTPDRLVLSYVGRGNTLRYRRVS